MNTLCREGNFKINLVGAGSALTTHVKVTGSPLCKTILSEFWTAVSLTKSWISLGLTQEEKEKSKQTNISCLILKRSNIT